MYMLSHFGGYTYTSVVYSIVYACGTSFICDSIRNIRGTHETTTASKLYEGSKVKFGREIT